MLGCNWFASAALRARLAGRKAAAAMRTSRTAAWASAEREEEMRRTSYEGEVGATTRLVASPKAGRRAGSALGEVAEEAVRRRFRDVDSAGEALGRTRRGLCRGTTEGVDEELSRTFKEKVKREPRKRGVPRGSRGDDCAFLRAGCQGRGGRKAARRSGKEGEVVPGHEPQTVIIYGSYF
jgi:hypothetical protein